MDEPVDPVESGEPVKKVETNKPLPVAKIKKSRVAWLYFLFPLGAAGLCFWFVYRDFIGTGPAIFIYFQDAGGLQANNTPIRFRGAEVGRVKSVELTKNQQYVKVKARLTGSAATLARAETVFWIVRPELKLGSITGLRTIVSGEYIAVHPGGGSRTNVFIGAEKEPQGREPGSLKIALLSDDLSSMRERSPVFYRGVQVGQVTGYQLSPDAKSVVVRAMILPEYAPLVRRNSVFWNAGGFNIRFGLFRGAEISTDSAMTLFTGGIEFATPLNVDVPASDGTVFPLNAKAKDEWKTWAPAITLRLPEQAPAALHPAQLEQVEK